MLLVFCEEMNIRKPLLELLAPPFGRIIKEPIFDANALITRTLEMTEEAAAGKDILEELMCMDGLNLSDHVRERIARVLGSAART
jgi:hypothetical protein